ncbi:MAG: hypothetical protein A2Y40_01135 [Candidatus Margulisbacteria bacterium GWF2_35_9]|nr:MAG: hypothetical protein A2Y40_01135 [Candidatus Margulisbacteria bacterium GWF2_35_9]
MFIDKDQYNQIIRIFPRICSDIWILNEAGKTLLMFNANQPFKGQWWFPGGRVHFGESRLQAAYRKLKEECDLRVASELVELGTFDLFVSTAEMKYHDVTTLFKFVIPTNTIIKTDSQALDHGWFTQSECAHLDLNPYVIRNINTACSLGEKPAALNSTLPLAMSALNSEKK